MPKPNKRSASGLTDKQARFVSEYLKDLNATQAAIRAGYSERTAWSTGHQNLQNPKVAEAIGVALAERAERVQIDADYVLRQAVKLHERCMQEIEPFTDRHGNHVHDEKGRGLYVFNAAGAAKALEMVGKHVNVMAFRERVDLSNPDGSLAPRVIDATKLSTEALRELMGAMDATPEPDTG